jgi:hypothetical protein
VGVGVLLERMEQNNQITDLDLRATSMNEGRSLLARLWETMLPNLMASLFNCGIGDDGFIAGVGSGAEHRC